MPDEKEEGGADQFKPIIPAKGLPDSGLSAQAPAEDALQAQAAGEAEPADKARLAAEILTKAIKGGGSWFYWIAALSVINTVTSMVGWDGSFLLGLGFTQLLDGFAKEIGRNAMYVIVPINLIVSGAYVLFGYFSCRAAKWAFVTGIVLYSLDTLLVGALLLGPVESGIIFMLAFHAWALYSMSKGLKAVGLLQKLEAQQPAPANAL